MMPSHTDRNENPPQNDETAAPTDPFMVGESRPDPNPIPVKDVLRRLGPTEDIRAYVYRTLIDIMPDRIYAKDTMCRFILANRAVAHLMGAKGPEELIGKTDFDFYDHELAERYVAVEQRVLRTGEPLIAYEQFTPNLATGEPQWTQTTKVPLRDFEGRVIGLVGLARDVTERRRFEDEIKQQNMELASSNAKLLQAREQLVQSEKLAAVVQLAAGVAHGISTPLESVFAKLDRMEACVRTMPDAIAASGAAQAIADGGELIREMREELMRVQTIVHDLNDFARVDTRAEWRDLDLHAGIDATLGLLANEIGGKADVRTEYGEIPKVRGVAAEINLVVMNLVVNALHALGPERGTITLRTGSDGECAWFEVVDQGCGIPQHVLPRIFDPFFTTKPYGQGSGLGLSLSYGIVQQHKGRIDVRSEVGKGSTFRVTLPATPPDE